MAKIVGQASNPLSPISKLEANGQACHHAKYMLLALDFCVTPTASFDLWMSRSEHHTFALVINFINS